MTLLALNSLALIGRRIQEVDMDVACPGRTRLSKLSCLFFFLSAIPGVDDPRHPGERDPDLHGCWKDLPPASDRGEAEAAPEEATHRPAEGKGVQQLQVCCRCVPRDTRWRRLSSVLYRPARVTVKMSTRQG